MERDAMTAEPRATDTADTTGTDVPDDVVRAAERIRLLTGVDNWTIPGDEALGLRPMIVSDGPAGARGTSHDPDRPSSSLPSPVALAATWDERLVAELTAALGAEARAKGIDVLLGPTVNLVRTPLGGRAFECFAEDPELSARIAVGYVRGLQSSGVAATVKHFVGNDSETDRWTYDVRIAEHVLRELYLVPFEAAVREAGAWLVMAGYNTVDGRRMTEHGPLLRDVLKHEWGFDGVVVSDWSAARDTLGTIHGGLDLVMPGPNGPWGEALVAALRAGEVAPAAIDERVDRLLRLAHRVGAAKHATQGADFASQHADIPVALNAARRVDEALLRQVAARAMTLLRNELVDGTPVLPLDPTTRRSIALLGPNVVNPTTQGGGSAVVFGPHVSEPVDALRAALAAVSSDIELLVHQGCRTWQTTPLPAPAQLSDPASGARGVRVELYDAEGTRVYGAVRETPLVRWWDDLPEDAKARATRVVLHTGYTAAEDGRHQIAAAGVGATKLFVDGALVAEADQPMPPDVVEALSRPPELRHQLDLTAGQFVDLRVESGATPEHGIIRCQLGVAAAPDEDTLLDAAVEAARRADVAILVVGSPEGEESEGYDRTGLALVGRQDELVRRVAAVNPRTVVVVNAGSPVLLPWAEDVATVLYAWLPGQEAGGALADVLLGVTEPSGRLPVTLPRVEADAPVLRAIPDGDGALRYDEGLLIGYRGYDRAGVEPRYPFGHGLGYTRWEFGEPELVDAADPAHEGARVVVSVRNTGARAGRTVVQVYAAAPDVDPARPLRVLAGFAVVAAEAGRMVDVEIPLSARAFRRFDETTHAFVPVPGEHTLHVGTSSRAFTHALRLTIEG
jgi:beta-glucosidase